MSDPIQVAPSATAGPGADFTLGDWLIQPSLNRASRNGTTIHLRPQLVDVLVCLATSPGRPVSRHELLDRVWPNQFVADTALARCVAELRQALGDSAQSPTLIETIPKRGYRLIAPVAPADGNGHSDGRFALADASADRRSPEGGWPALKATAPGTAAGALGDSALDLPRPELLLPRPQPRLWLHFGLRSRRRLVMSSAAVAALAAALMAWRLLWTPAPPPLAERDPVVLAFTNTTGDPVFDGTLRLALAIHLEQSPYVRVTPERQVQETLQFLGQPATTAITPDLALQICERIGASAILHGSIAPLGQRYVVGLEAIACASRDTIARAQAEAAGKEHVLEALSRAANTIRRDLGESMASVERFDVPLVQASTPSLEALRAVSLGDREGYLGAYVEALQQYQRATAIDPEFALAHARTGVALLNLRRRGEAIAPLTRAFELSGRVTASERLYIEGHYYNGVLESPLRAIDAFSVLSQSASHGLAARVNLASLYQQVGLWYPAIDEAREAVRLEPDSAVASLVLAGALAGAGRFDEALQALAETRGRESPSTHDLRYDLAFLTGDEALMRSEDEYASREPGMTPFLLVRRARLAMYRGRFREARDLWAQVRADAEARQDVTAASTALLSEAGSRALLGDRTGTSTSVAAALDIDRSPGRLAQSALVSALAGDVAASRRQLEEYDRTVPPGAGRDLEFVAPARAALAVAEGRFAEVVALLEPIRPYELGSRFEFVPSFIRAHALLGLQAYDQAAEVFQVILDNRGVMAYSVFYPLALLGQARALAASGEAVRSLQGYQALLDLWKDADAELALLAAARREAAALRRR
ncbi:MAG: winged helix-turn-helix domain-containing protein [Acidobacteriota bacterium]